MSSPLSGVGQTVEVKYIKVIEGKEQNIRLASEIAAPGSLLYPAFQQAVKALREIVDQTQSFYKELDGKECSFFVSDLLAHYNGNIIAFEAKRGYGKTQTMLSFSSLIEKKEFSKLIGNKENEKEEKQFIVLPMIAPSAMEENQKLLYVILSRLYSYAQKLSECLKYDRDRITLSRLLQKCLSGINGLKRINRANCDDDCDDFETLQDVNDGLALRNHFWELLHFLAQQQKSQDNTFFVIQLDDVDSQIKCGYQIMDDIRKYLLIPNLVILLSTERELLFRDIFEEHLKQFPELQRVDSRNTAPNLSEISTKYIDKLIPPSHMVHLPRIEEFLGRGGSNELMLYYLQEDLDIASSSLETLTEKSVFAWEKDAAWDLQDVLFGAIYEKTGLVFAKHSNYMHNIIPHSLRGLSQLLYLLKQMESIPLFGEDSFKSEQSYLNAWQERIAVTEYNLSQFRNYFVNDWLQVKFNRIEQERNDREFLRELSEASNSDRIILAIDYLYRFIGNPNAQQRKNELLNERQGLEKEYDSLKSARSREKATRRAAVLTRINEIDEKAANLNVKPPYSLPILNYYLIELSQSNTKSEDYLLLFSIHVILDIERHFLILEQRKRAVLDRLKKQKNGELEISSSDFNHYLAFDLDPNITYLPQTCLILGDLGDKYINLFFRHFCREGFQPILRYPQDCGDARGRGIYEYHTERVHGEQGANLDTLRFYRWIRESLFAPTGKKGEYLLSVFNFPTVLLNLGKTYNPEKDHTESVERARDTQKYFYRFQELAVFIMGSWDVQERIHKDLLPTLGQKFVANTPTFFRSPIIDANIGFELCRFLFRSIDSLLDARFRLMKKRLFPKLFNRPDTASFIDEGLGDTFTQVFDVNNRLGQSNPYFTISAFPEIFSALFFKDYNSGSSAGDEGSSAGDTGSSVGDAGSSTSEYTKSNDKPPQKPSQSDQKS